MAEDLNINIYKWAIGTRVDTLITLKLNSIIYSMNQTKQQKKKRFESKTKDNYADMNQFDDTVGSVVELPSATLRVFGCMAYR